MSILSKGLSLKYDERNENLFHQMASTIQCQAERLKELERSLKLAELGKRDLEADFQRTLDLLAALQIKVAEREKLLEDL